MPPRSAAPVRSNPRFPHACGPPNMPVDGRHRAGMSETGMDVMQDRNRGSLKRLAAQALTIVGLTAALLVPLSVARAETDRIRIAQQFGISYLPLVVVREQSLLETAAADSGIPDLKVEWQKF